MQRFLLTSYTKGDNTIILDDNKQCHHIRDVLRFKAGDIVVLFDGKGKEFICAIEKMGEKITFAVKEERASSESNVLLTVACAIPKKAKFDDIIDKLTQLGAHAIIPLMTERVIVKLDKAKEKSRLERWNKIALSASEQSQRGSLPIVESLTEIKDLIRNSGDFDLKLIPVLIDERRHLNKILEENKPRKILVLIGPEGDFTPDEVAMARDAGFIPVTLGEQVLRVDTAAEAVASFIKLFYENR